MRIKSTILIAAIATSVAICIFAIVQIDFKLALAAFSACLALYSAWQFQWREPEVEPIGGIYPEGINKRQGNLFFFNDGAHSTLLRITEAESKQNNSRKYDFTSAMQPISGSGWTSFKLTLINGDPHIPDRISINYSYNKGLRIVKRKVDIIWEGAEHGNKT